MSSRPGYSKAFTKSSGAAGPIVTDSRKYDELDFVNGGEEPGRHRRPGLATILSAVDVLRNLIDVLIIEVCVVATTAGQLAGKEGD